jgi:hypothetical protein
LKLPCRREEFRGQDSIVGIDLSLVLAIAIPVQPQAARVSRSAALASAAQPSWVPRASQVLAILRIILRHLLKGDSTDENS